jgi:hypothetical protein
MHPDIALTERDDGVRAVLLNTRCGCAQFVDGGGCTGFGEPGSCDMAVLCPPAENEIDRSVVKHDRDFVHGARLEPVAVLLGDGGTRFDGAVEEFFHHSAE